MFNFIKKGVVGVENRDKSDKEKRKKEKKPHRENPTMNTEELLRLNEVRTQISQKFILMSEL